MGKTFFNVEVIGDFTAGDAEYFFRTVLMKDTISNVDWLRVSAVSLQRLIIGSPKPS